jgi:hypothetical protein
MKDLPFELAVREVIGCRLDSSLLERGCNDRMAAGCVGMADEEGDGMRMAAAVPDRDDCGRRIWRFVYLGLRGVEVP